LDFSYWIDYLGFTTEGRLAAMLIIPSLGVPNWSVIYIINTTPSVALFSISNYQVVFGKGLMQVVLFSRKCATLTSFLK
jgi:hypothetical protein